MTNAVLSTSVMDFVRQELSSRVKVPIEQIDASSQLIDLGLQSIDAVIMCGEIEDRFQVELDPSAIFQFQTVGTFVEDILKRLSH
mgnify:CR=1 FL=1